MFNMFTLPEDWHQRSADERLAFRWDYMVDGIGIDFESPETEALYKERATLLRDAIELKKAPARVPVFPSVQAYYLNHAGLTMRDFVLDIENTIDAFVDFNVEFQPDAFALIDGLSGLATDALGSKLWLMPGIDLPDDSMWQFVEGEHMTADEYPLFLSDPSDFLVRKFLPRTCSVLEPLANLLDLKYLHYPSTAAVMFSTPEFAEIGRILSKAGDDYMETQMSLYIASSRLQAAGFPLMYGGTATAPFDTLGNTLRGTRGILTDMYRHPDELIEACERFVPVSIDLGLMSANATGNPCVIFGLHKGADGFMSTAQFEKFYWPSLKKVILAFIEEGLTPIMFAEGSYDQRLEVIADLPKGKCVWWFDQTDMRRAKEILGETSCIMGNVPASVMAAGTPDEVKTYCKDIVDVAGEGGGLILSNGAGIDQTTPERIRAMIDFTKEYGTKQFSEKILK